MGLEFEGGYVSFNATVLVLFVAFERLGDDVNVALEVEATRRRVVDGESGCDLLLLVSKFFLRTDGEPGTFAEEPEAASVVVVVGTGT